MESRRISEDIVVLREPNQRAVLVRGNEHITAIDIPTERDSLRELFDASKTLATGGINLAILTHDVDDGAFSDGPSGMRVVRGDRNPASPWKWDTVPTGLLRNKRMTVQLVRDRRILHDDAGRAFHLEPCAGAPSTLAVRIQPENLLVICDDLRPNLPPRLGSASVDETLARYEEWLSRAPQALVPASGIPLAGDQVIEALEKSISYLSGLRSRMQVEMSANRYPWERLIHSIAWCDHWDAPNASRPLVERHRSNVQDIAADILRVKFPEMAEMVAA